MIYYLTTAKHSYTMREYLEGLGAPLADRVKVLTYPQFVRPYRVPRATYIFSDIDRLSGSQSYPISEMWKRLQDGGCRLLNHPMRSMRRYDLLRWLHENGINDFDTYMLIEHRKPKRFPVFIRRAHDHEGAMSALLPDQAALDAAIAEIRDVAEWPGDKMITEYIDTSSADGIYRKYAAYRLGDEIFARQIMAAEQWVVKKPEVDTPALAAEEAAYIREDPHRDLLMRVFRAAKIEYGRIDYAVVDGKVQVFEINTNPSVIGPRSSEQVNDPNSLRGAALRPVMKRYMEALAALDTVAPGPRIRLR